MDGQGRKEGERDGPHTCPQTEAVSWGEQKVKGGGEGDSTSPAKLSQIRTPKRAATWRERKIKRAS